MTAIDFKVILLSLFLTTGDQSSSKADAHRVAFHRRSKLGLPRDLVLCGGLPSEHRRRGRRQRHHRQLNCSQNLPQISTNTRRSGTIL